MQKHFNESIKSYKQTIAILEGYCKEEQKELKIDHVELLSSAYERLGHSLRQLQKEQEALDNYLKAKQITTQILPLDNFFNIKISVIIGEIYRKLNDIQNSIKILEEILGFLNPKDQKLAPLYTIAVYTLILNYV